MQNTLSADEELRLPRPTWHAFAQGPPGVDRFVAIVSKNPRDFAEVASTRAGSFLKLSTGQGVRPNQPDERRSPPWAGQARCPGKEAAECTDAYGAAMFSIEEVGGKK